MEMEVEMEDDGIMTISRNNCTYCGGDVEDEFTNAGLITACLLFPLGDHQAWKIGILNL